jgi:cytochrome P450
MASGTDYSRVNFFSDPGIAEDPYPFYEYLRAQCPVTHVPSSGVVAVTGYDELNEVSGLQTLHVEFTAAS